MDNSEMIPEEKNIDDTEGENEPDDEFTEDARKGRRSFAKLRRELSEEELSTSGVQKLLLDEIERLEKENITLSGYKEKIHDVDKTVAIFEDRIKRDIVIDIVFGVCLSLGAGALVFASSDPELKPYREIISIFGGILILLGIVSKARNINFRAFWR